MGEPDSGARPEEKSTRAVRRAARGLSERDGHRWRARLPFIRGIIAQRRPTCTHTCARVCASLHPCTGTFSHLPRCTQLIHPTPSRGFLRLRCPQEWPTDKQHLPSGQSVCEQTPNTLMGGDKATGHRHPVNGRPQSTRCVLSPPFDHAGTPSGVVTSASRAAAVGLEVSTKCRLPRDISAMRSDTVLRLGTVKDLSLAGGLIGILSRSLPVSLPPSERSAAMCFQLSWRSALSRG